VRTGGDGPRRLAQSATRGFRQDSQSENQGSIPGRATKSSAIETYGSGEYHYVEGQLRRSKKPVALRGLNRNHHDLKWILKSAAVKASSVAGPLHQFYQGLLAKGIKPSLARLTLARKIAAIVLIVWKKGAHFDAQYLKPQAA
jgi:hypothetical protein